MNPSVDYSSTPQRLSSGISARTTSESDDAIPRVALENLSKRYESPPRFISNQQTPGSAGSTDSITREFNQVGIASNKNSPEANRLEGRTLATILEARKDKRGLDFGEDFEDSTLEESRKTRRRVTVNKERPLAENRKLQDCYPKQTTCVSPSCG